jgi:hypothetical protein
LKRRQRDAGNLAPDEDYGTATGIPDPTEFDLEAIWDEEWERNLLAAALERIKSRVDSEQFQIFDLYCVANWPAPKVARTLSVGIGRVYLAKHRIGALLRKEVRALAKQTL